MISKSELDRIRKNAGEMQEMDAEKQKHEERERLRVLSQMRAANWNNTIDGQRQIKQREREERMRQEEEERRRIDEEEEQFQAEERRKQIERANKLLFHENDRVKRFNSQLLVAEVVRERKQQMDVKTKKEEYERMSEQEWMTYQEEVMKRQTEANAIMLEQAKKRALEAKEIQKKQMGELLEARRKLLSAQEHERQLLIKLTDADIQREKERNIDKFRKNVEYSKKYLAQTQEMKEREEAARLKELEDEQKNNEYVKLKETLSNEQTRREKQRFEEQQRIKQKLIDRQAKMMKSNQREEEERLEKQQALIKQREKKREDNEQAAKKKMLETISASRAKQLEYKEQLKKMEELEKQYFNRQWRDRNEMLALEDALERQNQILKALSVQDTQKQQMREKRKLEREERRQTRREGRLMAKVQAKEDRQFEEYVQNALQEFGDDVPIIRKIKK